MTKNLQVAIDTSAQLREKEKRNEKRRQLEKYYQEGTNKLVDVNGKEIHISNHVFEVLLQILPALEQGRTTVTISPNSAEMTTQQAADILNVSRPHLIKLLDNNEIPYTRTGSHRRIQVKDVMDYKEKKDTRCRKSLQEMTEIMEENGLFD